jgi:DNA replication and repair protein RecF
LGTLAVTRLTLSHFRSHLRTELVLGVGPVALTGPNGAGKTNVLEALSLLSPGRGLRRAAPEDLARRPEALGWKVRAALASGHEVETWAEPGMSRQVRIDGKPAPQTALGRVLRVLWLVPAMDRLWTEAAEGRRRFLDRIALSFHPDHADAALAYDKAMRERNRMLKDQVSDARWFAAVEARMAEAARELEANRQAALVQLAAAQDGAATAFPRAGLALIGPEGAAPLPAADLARALHDGRRRDLAAGRTLSGPHRDDLQVTFAARGIAAAQCSTGEQKALLLSLILANARALASTIGTPPILLLDEVAAHLDPDRRAALYHEIAALGAQALLTGTESALFDSLGPGAQRFVLSSEDHSSRVDHPAERS